jgi:tripartite-type tricarboxylate transporter receptor subunit TctC
MRPLRLVISSAPGEAGDAVAVAIAGGLSKRLNQRVTIENHLGVPGIAAERGARAKPDGYTLTMGTTTTHVLAPLTLELPYDAVEDFDPVTQVASMPYVLAAPAAEKAQSVGQLIARAKSNPSPLSYSSMGDPLGHLGMQMLKMASGMTVTQSADPRWASLGELLRKNVDVFFVSASAAMPHVAAGTLRAIAVSTDKRAAVFPKVPTIAESGYPGFEVAESYAVFVPRGTSAEIIHRLHVELAHVALTRDVKEQLGRHGAEAFTSISNVEVLHQMRAESARFGSIMSQVNYKPHGDGKPVPGPAKL